MGKSLTEVVNPKGKGIETVRRKGGVISNKGGVKTLRENANFKRRGVEAVRGKGVKINWGNIKTLGLRRKK